MSMGPTSSPSSKWSLSRAVIFLGFGLISTLTPIRADEASEGQKTTAATLQSWYKYVDGKPDLIWEKVPGDLKIGFTLPGWKMVTSKESEISEQHGRCLERKLVSSTYNSPLVMRNGKKLDGEYVTIVYESSYADKESAFETFYFKKDPSAAWPLMGYLIQIGDSPVL